MHDIRVQFCPICVHDSCWPLSNCPISVQYGLGTLWCLNSIPLFTKYSILGTLYVSDSTNCLILFSLSTMLCLIQFNCLILSNLSTLFVTICVRVSISIQFGHTFRVRFYQILPFPFCAPYSWPNLSDCPILIHLGTLFRVQYCPIVQLCWIRTLIVLTVHYSCPIRSNGPISVQFGHTIHVQFWPICVH